MKFLPFTRLSRGCLGLILLFAAPQLDAQCPPEVAIAPILDTGDTRQIAALIEQIKDCPGIDDSLGLAYHLLGAYYFNENRFEDCIAATQKAIAIRQRQSPIDTFNLGKSNFNLGYAYIELKQYAEAEPPLLESERLYKLVDTPRVLESRRQMAVAYQHMGDYEKAMRYLSLARADFARFPQQELHAHWYNTMGLTLNSMGRHQEAVDSLQKAVQLYRQIGGYDEDIAACQLNMAYSHYALGQFEEALLYFEESLDYTLKQGTDQELISKNLNNIGETQRRLGHLEAARNSLEKALALALESDDLVRAGRCYDNLAEVYVDQGKPEEALRYFDMALRTAIPGFSEDQLSEHDYSEQLRAVADKRNLLIFLSDKARYLQKRYRQTGDSNYLQLSLQHYRLVGRLIQYMRAEFTRDSKLFWLSETYPIFERSIAAGYELFQLSGADEWMEEVWSNMEQNKAVLLLESIQADKRNMFAGIPDSLLLQQSQAAEAISRLRRRSLELGQEGSPDRQEVRQLQLEIIRRQEDLADLERQLRKDYPVYSQFTQAQTASRADIQQDLPDDQTALLEFFWGDSSLYLLALTRNSRHLLRLEIGDLPRRIEELQRGISLEHLNEAGLENHMRLFNGAAYAVYQATLADILSRLPSEISRLIIVPDGPLSSVPFSLLLQEENPTARFDPGRQRYLLHDYAISYSYSASLLVARPARRPGSYQGNFLGIAPLFDGPEAMQTRACDLAELSRLSSNTEEVNGLLGLLGGKVFVDREASREAFLNNAPYYRVLHLATHACADETESARSRIFFADDYLYAHELYTLDLHADMAVLSACETGVGEFRKGEGVISLARGFAYAGIPSTVMSLWSVNDRATSDLMQLFYRNLKAGMPKDRALQSAKLEFLSTREDKASLLPAYWAAFVHFGDVDPLPIGGSRIPNWTWALLLIPILAAGWFFRRRVSRA
ncbi:MAG: CHAT domain-containing protein [Saprospiraceae bacterium]|nr:CHAT domain-containing protein [Saprospiraceae bacterium]